MCSRIFERGIEAGARIYHIEIPSLLSLRKLSCISALFFKLLFLLKPSGGWKASLLVDLAAEAFFAGLLECVSKLDMIKHGYGHTKLPSHSPRQCYRYRHFRRYCSVRSHFPLNRLSSLRLSFASAVKFQRARADHHSHPHVHPPHHQSYQSRFVEVQEKPSPRERCFV